jgi:hypothetical protein
MGCKYVKEFEHPESFGFSGSAGKTPVKTYMRGGKVCKDKYAEGGKADIAQDKAMIKTAVHKHEKSMHPGEPMTKLARGGVPPTSREPLIGRQKAKVGTVMGEFKKGELHSGGTGKVVTNPKQAVAIAMSEARRSKK